MIIIPGLNNDADSLPDIDNDDLEDDSGSSRSNGGDDDEDEQENEEEPIRGRVPEVTNAQARLLRGRRMRGLDDAERVQASESSLSSDEDDDGPHNSPEHDGDNDDIIVATEQRGDPRFDNNIGFGGNRQREIPTNFDEFVQHFLYICTKHMISKAIHILKAMSMLSI